VHVQLHSAITGPARSHGMPVRDEPVENAAGSMKIGLLAASLSRHGGNISAALSALGRSLHRPPEINVAAFGLRDEMTDADLGAWGTMTVTAAPVRGPRKFGFSRELDLALAQAELDLLHIHGLWTYTSVASRRWADATARPYIITPHGMLDPWAVRRSRWKKVCAALLFELAHLRGAVCLHARCEAEVRALRALKLRNPICVIPNAVEPMPEPPSGERGFPVLDGATGQVLLCLGPLLFENNAQTLLSAWQLACKRSPRGASDWSLVAVGRAEDRPTLLRQCAALGIEKTVRFVTFASATASPALWEMAAAVVLLPAASEQTLDAIRAWSHGLPVLLCGACLTPADLCAPAAIVVQPTVESFAEGLLTLTGMSDAERAAMGARARRLLKTHPAPAALAEDMTRVYRWVLHRGPKPRCVVDH
jgi:glycosyltransferase involved in cell wall biosynthesis